MHKPLIPTPSCPAPSPAVWLPGECVPHGDQAEGQGSTVERAEKKKVSHLAMQWAWVCVCVGGGGMARLNAMVEYSFIVR